MVGLNPQLLRAWPARPIIPLTPMRGKGTTPRHFTRGSPRARVAQSVEHMHGKHVVGSSILPPGSIYIIKNKSPQEVVSRAFSNSDPSSLFIILHHPAGRYPPWDLRHRRHAHDANPHRGAARHYALHPRDA